MNIWFIVDVVAFVFVLLAGYAGLVRLASSLIHLSNYAATIQNSPHQRQVDSENMMPVSLILPEAEADRDIVKTVATLLALDYPEYEVIVVCNSARSRALQKLKAGYGLLEMRQPVKRSVPMQAIRQVYRSPQHPGLVVLDKKAGGRNDALNAGVNVSRYPIFVSLAPGTTLKNGALAELALPFMRSFQVAAVGSLPRIAKGGQGVVAGLLQAEYLRSYPSGLAVPGQKKLTIIPGAFGAFRKSVVIEKGGFGPRTGESEMVVSLYRDRAKKSQCREVQLLAAPVFTPRAPGGLVGLFRQYRRWQKERVATLCHNMGMLFNPRYGRGGVLDIPGNWLFEVIGPFLEVAGCIAVPVSYGLGYIGADLFWMFWAAEILFGMVLSLAAVMSQQIVESDKPSFTRLLSLTLFAIFSNIGYRQVVQLFKVIAMFTPNPANRKG